MKEKKGDFVSFNKLLTEELENDKFKEVFDKEYLKITLINEIVKIRKNNNMTQAEMAKLVGIPQGNISRFERGKIEPSLDFLQKITSKLGYKINVSLEKII